MSKVLDQIHGISKYDFNKAFNLYSSTGKKKGLIYYENNPSFYIETATPDGNLYVTVPLRVFGDTGGLQTGEIVFKLVEPSVLYNSMTMKYIPKLANSVMKAVVRYNGNEYDQLAPVRTFRPTWLSLVVTHSRMGD